MLKTKYWTPNGESLILRDLADEHKNWNRDKYLQKDGLDGYNFLWSELVDFFNFNSNGCVYEVGNIRIKENDIVVDLGANIGIWSNIAISSGAKHIFSFEPSIRTFSALVLNTYNSNISPFCLAVSDRNSFTSLPVHLNGDSVGSSLQNNTFTDFKMDNILTITLDYLFDIGMFTKIDFLKVDIEGFEGRLIYSISKERLDKIRTIVIEYHPKKCSIDHEDIIKYLRLNGFNHRFTLHTASDKIITFEKG